MDELNLGGDVCILYLYLGLLGFRFLSFFRLPWRRRQWHPTQVFLPGKSQGRRSLVGCCPWGRTESDTTEVTQQQQQQASLVAQMVKNLPAMQKTRLGRSPGKGNGNPLPYSCLENSMDKGAWQATSP